MSKDQEIIDFGLDNYLTELDSDLTFVDVGILAKDGAKGEFPLAQLAAVQEFGAVINVTDKMRKFLGATGLHLKKETTEITIPARAPLRVTFEDQSAELQKRADELDRDIMTKKTTRRAALSELGQRHQQQIQKNMSTKGKFAANHPYTVERKGSSTPLIDTGRLRQSISHEVG